MSSIGVSHESKENWKKYKNHPGESFEHMINRILKQSDEEDYLTEEDLKGIETSLNQIKNGQYVTLDEATQKTQIMTAYRVIMQVINDKLIVHFVEIVKRGKAYD